MPNPIARLFQRTEEESNNPDIEGHGFIGWPIVSNDFTRLQDTDSEDRLQTAPNTVA